MSKSFSLNMIRSDPSVWEIIFNENHIKKVSFGWKQVTIMGERGRGILPLSHLIFDFERLIIT